MNSNKYIVPSISFFYELVGVVMGSWVARIPDVKTAHGLSDGVFGLILICGVGGGMLSFPLISPITNTFGSNSAALFGATTVCLLTPIIGLPYHEVWILAIGIAGLGFGWGIQDVAVTAQASLYEKYTGKHMMGFFQANLSIGSFIGAIIGGVMSAYGISPFLNFIFVSAIGIPLAVIGYYGLYTKSIEVHINENSQRLSILIDDADDARKWAGHSTDAKDVENNDSFCVIPTLYPMCFIMLVASMGEGSISDWSTVFMTDTLDFSTFFAALGFAIFSIIIAIGRWCSDYLRDSIDTTILLRFSGLIASGGVALFTSSIYVSDYGIQIAMAYGGLFIAGAGISVCFPLLTSMVTKIPGMKPTDAIATITAFAYFGALIGPPLFGGLSTLLGGLQWSLTVDAALLLSVPCCAALIPSMNWHRNSVGRGNSGYEKLSHASHTSLYDEEGRGSSFRESCNSNSGSLTATSSKG